MNLFNQNNIFNKTQSQNIFSTQPQQQNQNIFQQQNSNMNYNLFDRSGQNNNMNYSQNQNQQQQQMTPGFNIFNQNQNNNQQQQQQGNYNNNIFANQQNQGGQNLFQQQNNLFSNNNNQGNQYNQQYNYQSQYQQQNYQQQQQQQPMGSFIKRLQMRKVQSDLSFYSKDDCELLLASINCMEDYKKQTSTMLRLQDYYIMRTQMQNIPDLYKQIIKEAIDKQTINVRFFQNQNPAKPYFGDDIRQNGMIGNMTQSTWQTNNSNNNNIFQQQGNNQNLFNQNQGNNQNLFANNNNNSNNQNIFNRQSQNQTMNLFSTNNNNNNNMNIFSSNNNNNNLFANNNNQMRMNNNNANIFGNQNMNNNSTNLFQQNNNNNMNLFANQTNQSSNNNIFNNNNNSNNIFNNNNNIFRNQMNQPQYTQNQNLFSINGQQQNMLLNQQQLYQTLPQVYHGNSQNSLSTQSAPHVLVIPPEGGNPSIVPIAGVVDLQKKQFLSTASLDKANIYFNNNLDLRKLSLQNYNEGKGSKTFLQNSMDIHQMVEKKRFKSEGLQKGYNTLSDSTNAKLKEQQKVDLSLYKSSYVGKVQGPHLEDNIVQYKDVEYFEQDFKNCDIQLLFEGEDRNLNTSFQNKLSLHRFSCSKDTMERQQQLQNMPNPDEEKEQFYEQPLSGSQEQINTNQDCQTNTVNDNQEDETNKLKAVENQSKKEQLYKQFNFDNNMYEKKQQILQQQKMKQTINVEIVRGEKKCFQIILQLNKDSNIAQLKAEIKQKINLHEYDKYITSCQFYVAGVSQEDKTIIKAQQVVNNNVQMLIQIKFNAAPFLSKNDYEIIPSMEELFKLPEQELRKINNFVIQRKNVGQIQFLQTVDLAYGNLDRDVQIEQDEVALYNQQGTNPGRGKGLNQPSRITMFSCFYRSINKYKHLDQSINHQKVIKKIKKECKRMNIKFISYDQNTGNWQYEVDYW